MIIVVVRAKFLGSDRLFCFNSISKFCNLKNPFAVTISSFDPDFRGRRFIVGTNERSGFYELWQLHKQLKNMEKSEA